MSEYSDNFWFYLNSTKSINRIIRGDNEISRKIWVIYQGEPYFIDYYSKFYKKYLLKKHTAREYEIATEDEIEDIYPVDDIPRFDIGQTVVTLTGQITQSHVPMKMTVINHILTKTMNGIHPLK